MATWSLCTGSVTGNALTAGISMAAVVAVASTTGLPSVLAALAAGIGALCTVAMSGMGDSERLLVHLSRWAGAGVWTTVGIVHPSPWSLWWIGVLIGGCVLGAALGPMLTRHAKDPAQADGKGLVLGATAKANEEWRSRIADRGGQPFAGIVVEKTTKWENGNGEDVRICMPKAGATVDNLRYLAPGLAADANLPHGATIEIQEPAGEGQRTVIMRVTTTLMTDEVIPHPLWEEQRSILDGIPIGVHPNGDTAWGPAREESWMVVGKRGSGKTTLLQGITATVGMCRDAVVWHIDLNGGGLTQPWVDMWLDGKVERCPVDWSAANIDEAIRMTRAAIRIAKHRKKAYRKLKRQKNVSLLPVSETLPEVVIILDEGAEALAAAGKGKVLQLAANLDEIQRIARNEALNQILSLLRGTGDLVPASMSTQTGVGVCLRVRQQKEIAAVFEQAYEDKMKPEHLPCDGAGWIGVEGGQPLRYQTWLITPAEIEEIGMRIAKVRPDLDEASATVAGEDYATRYERMRTMFIEDGEIVDDEPDEPEATGGQWTSDWDLFGTATKTKPAPTPQKTPLPEGEDGIDDAELVEEEAAPPESEIREGAVALLAIAIRFAEGKERASTTKIIAKGHLDITPKALGDRFRKWGCPTGRQQIDGAEVRGPGVVDLMVAMDRISSGGPIEVAE